MPLLEITLGLIKVVKKNIQQNSESQNSSSSTQQKSDKQSKTNQNTPKQKELTEDVSQKKSFIQWIKQYDQDQQEKVIDRAEFKEKAARLIDEFINNQPKLTPKKNFYSAIDMANQSLQHSEDVVSETLANIIFKQGNHQKSIQMYKSLMLKYPKKKAYFADLIEKIKNYQKK